MLDDAPFVFNGIVGILVRSGGFFHGQTTMFSTVQTGRFPIPGVKMLHAGG